MPQREEARFAPAIKYLARVCLVEFAVPYKSEKSVCDDQLMIRRFIDPTMSLRGAVEDAPEPYRVDNPVDREIAKVFGATKDRAVGYGDIDDIHAKVTTSGRRVTAKRLCAMLSKMFSFRRTAGVARPRQQPLQRVPAQYRAQAPARLR